MKKAILILCLLLALAACSNPADEVVKADNPSVDPATIELGETVFRANCSACHATKNKDTLVGPSMVGLVERAGKVMPGMNATAYIEESILDPVAYLNEGFPNVMPATYGNSLSDEQFNAVVAFLLTFD